MAGELGFLHSYKRLVSEPLRRMREGDNKRPGKDIGLFEFLQNYAQRPDGGFGLTNSQGQPITPYDFWCDLGLDPAFTTLSNLISLSGDIAYLAPEMVREFIVKGIMAKPWSNRLCAGNIKATSMSIISPWIEYKDVDLVATGEAETIAEASITWGSKESKIQKRAKAIKFTDELLLSTPLNLLQPWLMRVGIEFAAAENKRAVATLINGDQENGSDAVAVIGTGNGASFAFTDFLRPWLRGSNIYYDWFSLLADEDTSYDLLTLDEFSKPQGAGSERVKINSFNPIIPNEMDHYVCSATGEGVALMVDPRFAMMQAVLKALDVEHERIVMKQITGTLVSLISGFFTLDRKARIAVKKDLAFSSNGFPTWMTPLD